MRIYPIFHIFLLELADLDTSAGPVPEIYFNLQKKIYTIEKILKVRKR
jgi:hypothetical protein